MNQKIEDKQKEQMPEIHEDKTVKQEFNFKMQLHFSKTIFRRKSSCMIKFTRRKQETNYLTQTTATTSWNKTSEVWDRLGVQTLKDIILTLPN